MIVNCDLVDFDGLSGGGRRRSCLPTAKRLHNLLGDDRVRAVDVILELFVYICECGRTDGALVGKGAPGSASQGGP